MNDDYLWDGSGEPDPEVQRLERLLGRFRHTRSPADVPLPVRRFPAGPLQTLGPRIAVAAAAALVVAGMWLAAPQGRPAWDVVRLEGAPKVGAERISQTGRLKVGDWLETDSASRAKIRVGQIGEVEIEPNTRLRLVQARPTEHRLALARGTVHARIWAPPRLFTVETPSAVAVDLGCTYTLTVDSSGAGLLRVTYGWVAFAFILSGRESFVPEGALCATRPGVGPGTPYYADASGAFQAALARLDFEQLSSEARAVALSAVLGEARGRDALTLWHLLLRVNAPQRTLVYDRMAALVPPPAGVTREGILAGNKQMLDLWWNQLGLRNASWWRLWEGSWPPLVKNASPRGQ